MPNLDNLKYKDKYIYGFEKDRRVITWLSLITSEQSIRQRLGILNGFVQWVGKTPSELFEEHKKDRAKDEKSHIAKVQLHGYYQYLTTKKKPKTLKVNSARRYVYSVLGSFYKRNDEPIVWQKGEVPAEEDSTKGDWKIGKSLEEQERVPDIYRQELLKRIRDGFNMLRDKAILCCKVSSGMDDVDLFELKVGKFWRGFDKRYGLCYISGNRIKSGKPYKTSFSSEACILLKEYIERRRNRGEEVDEDCYLFISKFPSKTIKREDGTVKIISKKATKNAFSVNLAVVCEEMNLHDFTPKSLREQFYTIMTDGGFPEVVVRKMGGWSVGALGSYSAKFRSPISLMEYLLNINQKEDTRHKNYDSITSIGNNNHYKMEVGTKMETLTEENTQMKELIKAMFNQFAKSGQPIELPDGIAWITEEDDISVGLTEEQRKELYPETETEDGIKKQIAELQAKLKGKVNAEPNPDYEAD